MIARTQTELLDRVKRNHRNVITTRWSDAEIYQAINDAVLEWAGRVSLPVVVSLSDWSNENRQVVLPDYVGLPVDAQYQTEDDTWASFPFQSVTLTDVGYAVVLDAFPPNTEARVITYIPNGPLPLTVPSKTADAMTSAATSVIVNAAVDVADVGHVKIDAEWMQYRGVTRGATTTTLLNLQRARFGTAVAAHNSAAAVNWGVVAPNDRLWMALDWQIAARLHALYLTDGAAKERELHMFQMRYAQDRLDRFWRTWRNPLRNPQVRISQRWTGRPARQQISRVARGIL